MFDGASDSFDGGISDLTDDRKSLTGDGLEFNDDGAPNFTDDEMSSDFIDD